ncbi:MFS transporter [Bacillus sp. KH172YL63]|uniref:MFS transporter n=1 Tax=Bacillus sp. KH172YL63 TaxID=2709784 RepID=UPI0013E49BDF|nr:MFS transporter [Bacillus sp. KH172YL63]BCB04166.1 putative MFS-type transporter YybF [Bacillus sp. KH172YL63]
MHYIERGTSRFTYANLALFAGGFSTFAILWGTQPILPEIAREFNLSPAQSSLSQSSATIALALSLLIAGSLSDVYGRKAVMTFSLFASSILAILTGFASDFHLLVIGRVLQGVTLAGLPAVAMAYLSEEIEARSLGMAMGLYISGNSVGGMSGRIISGILTDHYNWHIALIGVGVISLLSSFIFVSLLPPSAHFSRRLFKWRSLFSSFIGQFHVKGLPFLFLVGFLLMGGFVSLYNYIGFELTGPPYEFSQTIVGFIFIVYIVGTFSSTWMGMLADTYGKDKILPLSIVIMLFGVISSLHPHIIVKIIGIAVFTFGFFAAHSIASSWVGRLAVKDKAQASALYLFAYYAGSSIGGTASGMFYHLYDWNGVVMMILLVTTVSLGISRSLGKIKVY